jgi:hypothetical protein
MSPRDIREVRIVFDVSDDLRVASADPEEGGEIARRSADPEEGGEVARSSDVSPWTTTHGSPTRAGAPSEEIRDRSPDFRPPPPPPMVRLYCRGPCEVISTKSLGPSFVLWPNDTEAGPRGLKLGEGRCAFEDRPLSHPPGQTWQRLVRVDSASVWSMFLDDPPSWQQYAERNLGAKIRRLAQHQVNMSWLLDLITRSDYVLDLWVRELPGNTTFELDEIGWDGSSFYPFPG